MHVLILKIRKQCRTLPLCLLVPPLKVIQRHTRTLGKEEIHLFLISVSLSLLLRTPDPEQCHRFQSKCATNFTSVRIYSECTPVTVIFGVAAVCHGRAAPMMNPIGGSHGSASVFHAGKRTAPCAHARTTPSL